MTAPAAVRFEGVRKRYLLGRKRWHAEYLAAALLPGGIHRLENRPHPSALWALQGLDLAVPRGSALGIIGRNGAGKSTTLMLVAGVTTPTDGRVLVQGRVGALLHLSAGFHPDLTGRENTYLHAAMHGLRRAEIDRIYPRVVEFAGLGDFMETPVKKYSSGMLARLGYAVAVQIDPDVLLVDEVLAVGDLPFQERCLAQMRSFRDAGKTILFVSHNLHHVESLCDRTAWIDRGRLRMLGPTPEVLARYIESFSGDSPSPDEPEPSLADAGPDDRSPLRLRGVEVRGEAGADGIRTGAPASVRISFSAERRIERPHIHLSILHAGREVAQASMLIDGPAFPSIEGEGVIACDFPALHLAPRVYQTSIQVLAEDGMTPLVPPRPCGSFRVEEPASAGSGPAARTLLRQGPDAVLPHRWQRVD